MRSSYKKLGQFISETNFKNEDLKTTTLLGVNVSKEMMDSKANLVGTDLSKYKKVSKGQFVYGPVTSRNGDRIAIALCNVEECIVSTSYTVFKIDNETDLMPEYLMMWFRRPEFDRYARYKSHGSVREIFGWDEMCDVELPVPPIEKQHEIVREYHTIVDRIKLNEQLNQKLEETARAIYKQWFEDFEFPISKECAASIGRPDLEGKPYKSSGAPMTWNDELEKEIPADWAVDFLRNFCTITSSRRIFFSEYSETGIPFYRGGEIILKKEGLPITSPLYISKKRFRDISAHNHIPQAGDILLTAVGTIGVSYLVKEEEFYFKDGNLIWFRGFKSPSDSTYLYDYMQSKSFSDTLEEITIGSTQNAITIATVGNQRIIKPSKLSLNSYFKVSSPINKKIELNQSENEIIGSLRNLILSKMANGGTGSERNCS